MARVLVVDDDPQLRRFLVEALATGGHDAQGVANGVEAIKKYRSDASDLVVLDMFMPEMDGIETLRKLRAMNPRVRVLAISGGGTRHHVSVLHSAEMLGAKAVLMKPFDHSDFHCAVERALAP